MKHRAFTLIEIMVAIVIMAVLILAIIPVYNKTVDEAQKRSAKTILEAIRGAEIVYQIDKNTYHSFDPLSDSDRTVLKMNIYNSSDWKYVVKETSSATATATRQRGKHKDEQIKVDIATGNIASEYSW